MFFAVIFGKRIFKSVENALKKNMFKKNCSKVLSQLIIDPAKLDE